MSFLEAPLKGKLSSPGIRLTCKDYFHQLHRKVLVGVREDRDLQSLEREECSFYTVKLATCSTCNMQTTQMGGGA